MQKKLLESVRVHYSTLVTATLAITTFAFAFSYFEADWFALGVVLLPPTTMLLFWLVARHEDTQWASEWSIEDLFWFLVLDLKTNVFSATDETLRGQLINIMTLAALIAGFAVGLTTAVTNEEIERYAKWELDTFVGRDSRLCSELVPFKTLVSRYGPDVIAAAEAYWDCDSELACSSTNSLATKMHSLYGVDPCGTKEELRLPRAKMETYKIRGVHQDIVYHTMQVVMSVSAVEVFGVCLLYSLSLQGSASKGTASNVEAVRGWSIVFSLPIFCMYLASIYNFIMFMVLSERIMKVKFVYCKDDLYPYGEKFASGMGCLLEGSMWYDHFAEILLLGCELIAVLHFCVSFLRVRRKLSSIRRAKKIDPAYKARRARWRQVLSASAAVQAFKDPHGGAEPKRVGPRVGQDDGAAAQAAPGQAAWVRLRGHEHGHASGHSTGQDGGSPVLRAVGGSEDVPPIVLVTGAKDTEMYYGVAAASGRSGVENVRCVGAASADGRVLAMDTDTVHTA